MNKIGIIDVGIGNLGSLKSAVYELGFDACMVNKPAELVNFGAIILPGVGSFGHGMQALKQAKLDEALCAEAEAGKPMLGICLGMQMLFSSGNEGRESKGLGIMHGTVQRLEERPSFHVPHMGWNDVAKVKPHPLWEGIKPGLDFYFIHSYRVVCDSSFIIGQTSHGEDFPSFVGRANVVGVQFHPEKSQRSGLRLLENFCLWDGQC